MFAEMKEVNKRYRTKWYQNKNKSQIKREGIIVPLDRRFVVYPRGASVDQGAGVEEVSLVYPGTHIYYPGHRPSRAAGSGQAR